MSVWSKGKQKDNYYAWSDSAHSLITVFEKEDYRTGELLWKCVCNSEFSEGSCYEDEAMSYAEEMYGPLKPTGKPKPTAQEDFK